MRLRVNALLAWMREGYPQSRPGEDYIALLGLLPRRLTPDEVVAVADQLRLSSDIDDIRKKQIKAAIRAHLLGHQIHKRDVKAVKAELAAEPERKSAAGRGEHQPGPA